MTYISVACGEGPMCYACDDVAEAKDCNHILQCSDNEVCKANFVYIKIQQKNDFVEKVWPALGLVCFDPLR